MNIHKSLIFFVGFPFLLQGMHQELRPHQKRSPQIQHLPYVIANFRDIIDRPEEDKIKSITMLIDYIKNDHSSLNDHFKPYIRSQDARFLFSNAADPDYSPFITYDYIDGDLDQISIVKKIMWFIGGQFTRHLVEILEYLHEKACDEVRKQTANNPDSVTLLLTKVLNCRLSAGPKSPYYNKTVLDIAIDNRNYRAAFILVAYGAQHFDKTLNLF